MDICSATQLTTSILLLMYGLWEATPSFVRKWFGNESFTLAGKARSTAISIPCYVLGLLLPHQLEWHTSKGVCVSVK